MEEFFMSVQKKFLSCQALVLLVFLSLNTVPAMASGQVTLYTPYTTISVSPGDAIEYAVDVINKSDQVFNGDIRISGIPRTWTYTLKGGGYTVGRIAVLPDDKKTLSLRVEVPFQVNKGTYTFRLSAGESASLPLTINVTEMGSSETEFTADQSNMQGNANATFTYRATLKNRTIDKQLYALMANAPRGWTVTFKADYNPVTSVELEPNTTKEITIEVKPPKEIKAGTYKIPVRAVTGSTSASMELEAVVTGNYEMSLTTPTGLLSTKITAGGKQKITLTVRNTGSADLTDIEMKATAPSKWEVTFEPAKIDKLTPGNETTVYATIQADKKAIPGDYVVEMRASTPETTSQISFRVMVKTPLIWGWIGVLVILAAIGGVVYLFRKFGRR
jgi:uncharacterized membrane protein